MATFDSTVGNGTLFATTANPNYTGFDNSQIWYAFGDTGGVRGKLLTRGVVAIDWSGGNPNKRPVLRQREAKTSEQLKAWGLRK